MEDLIVAGAAAFTGAALKKAGEQFGGAIANQVQKVRQLIDRKSPEDAEVIEGIIENPTDANSEQVLMDKVVKLAQTDNEIKEALTTLKKTVETQAPTSLQQEIKNLGNQFNSPVINPTFNQTFN